MASIKASGDVLTLVVATELNDQVCDCAVACTSEVLMCLRLYVVYLWIVSRVVHVYSQILYITLYPCAHVLSIVRIPCVNDTQMIARLYAYNH